MIKQSLVKNEYYKLARPDGWDFYSGKTINYRDSIGKMVKVENLDDPVLCSQSVLHASKVAVNCFAGASIPCSMFIVEGKKVVGDKVKCGFKELYIKDEILPIYFDEIFGFRYQEALQPLDPRKISREQTIKLQELRLLKNWASVCASTWASISASVWASVWASARDSVWASVWTSARDSVWASEAAYIGTLFYKVKKWLYVKHEKNEYPFQPAVDLLKLGLIPTFDGTNWYLLGNEKLNILWKGTRYELQ